MKQGYLIALSVIVFFISCKKDVTGNGGGNGGGGSISITSITASAYCDDTITITGSGFDADATKDTVKFGILNSSGSFSIPDANACVVNSASATQLKVTISNSFNFGGNLIFLNPLAVARVQTAKGTAYSGHIIFKAAPQVTDIEDLEQSFPANTARVGDSIASVNALGLDSGINSLTIAGIIFSSSDFTFHSAQFGVRLPKNLFGDVLDETVHQSSGITVTLIDGKVVTETLDIYTSPLMRANMSSSNTVFYKSSSPDGAVVKVYITGVNIKSDSQIDDVSPAGTVTAGVSGATEFASSAEIDYGIAALPPGQHVLYLYRMENGAKKYYSQTGFTIYP